MTNDQAWDAVIVIGIYLVIGLSLLITAVIGDKHRRKS